jgi:hypothetical protein
VEWLRRRFAGCKDRLTFGDFVSESFAITGGLDQGDPHSGFLYGIYNTALAEIPHAKQGKDRVDFMDDNRVVMVAPTFPRAHKKIPCMMERPDGINDWGTSHNAAFSPANYQVADFS